MIVCTFELRIEKIKRIGNGLLVVANSNKHLDVPT